MLDQLFRMIEATASSEHAALLISLAIGVALAWGWWRREGAHSARYDQLQAENTQRENVLLDCLKQREEELAGIAREAFQVLQDVSAAMAGMERTLDGVEALVRVALNNRLHGKDGSENGKQTEQK